MGSTKNPEITLAFSSLVMERSAFDRDYLKPCQHTRECTAPLACFEGSCQIPPSIVGRVTPETPTVRVTTDTGVHEIYLEIVDDDYTMQRGMMMRRTCLKNWGMLFVYPSEGYRSFWMHNTYLSLDMVFIRRDGSVSNVIANIEPLNDVPRYESTDRVRYVLELPAGNAAELGIRSGSKFDMMGI